MRKDTTSTESVFAELARIAATAEQSATREIGRETEADDGIERELDEMMTYVDSALPIEEITFDEDLVKENLDEVLLLLIALHEETHGKELLSDLSYLFDATVSPGTVYPRLHELDEKDVLSMQAKVQTKEYSIDDEAYVQQTVEQTMIQHLSFGLLLYAFLSRL
ncbi:helix-turn-helix transcriptional regulator [Natronobacterium gregoryi]|uniref:PadR family transcriptional regulator n=2 Tax=Natronobacterium gregoryi TaxID=44930 RepID=L0AJ99_NATGS|nr:helix-turn-helix transcriptional regulator [Natronobacterium gregoryi]AFZ73110.1 Transcriptional regulator PadR-like family [Natronobacterium gregoryi SP2]ELY70791.1 PadR family transcriptional regulator [Natronobacterium gregoryi SP2]PLK20371.1 PadR family transcriptional regulator [Natronobacterium gregoryi SP2]SFI60968.1 transcriptional regulator, PadR family [Natronobacterium gregoryi]